MPTLPQGFGCGGPSALCGGPNDSPNAASAEAVMASMFEVLANKLGVAMQLHTDAAWTDAQNTLQDILDVRRDYLRGPGG
jgi:hypothetical protein